MRRSRTSLITFAILTVGAVGAGAAMAAVTPQVTASGTPQVVAMREAGNWAFLGSSNGWADVQSSPGTPQPQLTLNLGKSQAPALVRLDWSGRVVCFDACNLRFVVDGQPTHETTDAPPFLYPRDGVLRDATVHDFAVLAKGSHVIGLQYSTQGRFEMRDWAITADATRVE